ncbi:PhoX family phosphatase [Povalibacter sp.]|uniref:PhoX family protein n=1 Tax=Povalibacter sp. TaxID=1962978 RepID=UPI002F3F1BF3
MTSPTFGDLLEQRLSRRQVLSAGAALAPLAAVPALFNAGVAFADSPKLGFTAIAASGKDAIALPPGYTYDIVARWGDSLFSKVPDLDASKLAQGVLLEANAAELQRSWFGQNCDAIHFFPFDGKGDRGILCVNNEYTDDALMYPGHPGFDGAVSGKGREYVRQHPQLVNVSIAATGVSVIEVACEQGRWRMVKDSRFNRRITADTPMQIRGPARGAALMRTHADPDGIAALGTFGNCAGGETPWGTYLTAEENIQDYFGNFAALQARKDVDAHIVEAHRCWRLWKQHSLYGWENVHARFDLAQEPCEPFRFGWIVEIDPRDPTRAPVKRTALGRFAHEGASPVVAPDGRIAVYMGDDDKFEYVYKFISSGRFDAKNPGANRDLLDAGTLHVARFDASGSGQWLPLVYDEKGPLNAAAGFRNQAEVLIKARAAAYVLGATPMDRPEDVEANPTTGRIYIACTRNDSREPQATPRAYSGREIDRGPNAANPRGRNLYGHIIEIREAGDDHTSLGFSWEVFILAGDPRRGRLITSIAELQSGKVGSEDTYFAGYTKAADISAIGSPDNIGFDIAGNLWIVTDGTQPQELNDGCWACPTTGPERGKLQRFMSAPVGAEVCGVQFTPDNTTLFFSIQHPGENGSVDAPKSHWPDGGNSQPRSSVIAVRRTDGGKVGS